MSLKWYGKEILNDMEIANTRALVAAAIYVQGDAKLRSPKDTHRLEQSIDYRIETDEAIIGTPIEYAAYQEFGTVKMKAQPFLRPAIDENKQEIINIFNKEYRRVLK